MTIILSTHSSYGPFPPVGLWLNILGYLSLVVTLFVLAIREGMISLDEGEEGWTAVYSIMILALGTCWGLLLPFILLCLVTFLIIKFIQKVKTWKENS